MEAKAAAKKKAEEEEAKRRAEAEKKAKEEEGSSVRDIARTVLATTSVIAKPLQFFPATAAPARVVGGMADAGRTALAAISAVEAAVDMVQQFDAKASEADEKPTGARDISGGSANPPQNPKNDPKDPKNKDKKKEKVGKPAPKIEPSKASTTQKSTVPKAETPKVEKPKAAEGKVREYKDLKRTALQGDNIEAHHMPNDKYMKSRGVPKSEGISMNVERQRHIEIHKELRSIDPKTSERDALAQSVLRTKKVYEKSNAYTPKIRNSLKEVIKQNKEKHPNLFEQKKVDNK